MEFLNNVKEKSVPLRLRKSVTDANLTSHTILTDDVFSYVDFYFKAHSKRIKKSSTEKKAEQNHRFYWEQARNFYDATKILPIESAPLPMYYCMLNAVKAYLLFDAGVFGSDMEQAFKGHGLTEGKEGHEVGKGIVKSLNDIYVSRNEKRPGVFGKFGERTSLHFSDFPKKICVKQLLSYLPFVHAAYISTYKVARKDECFIPLETGSAPTFMYTKSGEIHLVANLDKNYFNSNALSVPNSTKDAISSLLKINPDNGFQVFSEQSFSKNELEKNYQELRNCFSYISGDNRLWYLRLNTESKLECVNSMVIEFAIVHRFSEIVRYKPEQMIKLLYGKDNWLVHEFLSLVLDQFLDELACEITKQEIMPTRVK